MTSWTSTKTRDNALDLKIMVKVENSLCLKWTIRICILLPILKLFWLLYAPVNDFNRELFYFIPDIMGEDDEEDDEEFEDDDGEFEEEDIGSIKGQEEQRNKNKKKKKLKPKKLKKYMLPLLLAYKMKYFALVPVMIAGLILLIGATGLAGFFFALFAAVMGLQKGGY